MTRTANNTPHKPRVFVLTSRAYEIAGGRTKATIERMIFLQKYFDTTLIEMSAAKYPGEDLPAIFAKYHTTFKTINPWTNSTRSSRGTKNYLDYIKSRTGGLEESRHAGGPQENFTVPTLTGGTIKMYAENGSIVRMREYHADGSVELLALDGRQNIFMREQYQQEEVMARYYMDDAGNVKAGFSVRKNGAKKFVYRRSDGRLVYSDTLDAHNIAFLHDVLRAGDVLISDVRHYDNVLAKLPAYVRKIHVWHEIAIDASGKKINPAYQSLVDPGFPVAAQDAIVVFTHDAQAEYSKNFPHLEKFFSVIPYGTSIKAPIAHAVREENLILSIGRLEKQKDVFAQVQAFAIFHKKYPQTYLKIFGEGSDKAQLQELADRLQIQDAVEFCGFSSDVNSEFQRAAMMIFSSRYETFGLTVLESLSNGTPVASYDVRYGTQALLKNTQNGIVAHQNSPQSLAEAMMQLYALKLSPQEVRHSIKDLSQESFERKWLALISHTGEEQ